MYESMLLLLFRNTGAFSPYPESFIILSALFNCPFRLFCTPALYGYGTYQLLIFRFSHPFIPPFSSR